MNEAEQISYQRDVLRTGALVLGAERPASWRPRDPHLRSIVDALGVLADITGAAFVDLGDLLDVLRTEEEGVEWASLLHYVMERWDTLQDAIDRWGFALGAAREVHRRSVVLSRRVDRLEQARAAAVKALEELHSACDVYELECTW